MYFFYDNKSDVEAFSQYLKAKGIHHLIENLQCCFIIVIIINIHKIIDLPIIFE
jgi:hypothetical protein